MARPAAVKLDSCSHSQTKQQKARRSRPGASRKASFPDLGFERDLEAKPAVDVSGPHRVEAVDIQRRAVRAVVREAAHELGHQPGGKASAPVLRQRADGADETNRLRARVVRVALDLPERDA